jgi:hypothetical protein
MGADDHRAGLRGAAAALATAFAIASAPAAAERVQARLIVQAIVLPSCAVSTSAGSAAMPVSTCTSGHSPVVTAEPSLPASAAVAVGPREGERQSTASSTAKVITLTY